MTTEQLRYFLEVARRRSFTEAAHTFYLTQPAITHQISALERELGTKLFLRTTRSVALTRAGELFLEDAKRILDQEDRALERLRQMGGSGQLELKIGYLNSPCRHFLPGLIRDYQERYPQVSLELIRRDAAGIQTGADEAEFDLSFSVLSDLQGLSGYACRKLATDFYCLVSPRQHPCVSNASIDYHKLATESFACLSRTAGAYMYKQFQQICRDLELAPSRVVEYPAMEDVLFAVECGQALAIMPYHIREYMKTDLAFVPLDGQNLTIDIGVAWRSPTDNPAVGWFVELINHSLVERPELF